MAEVTRRSCIALALAALLPWSARAAAVRVDLVAAARRLVGAGQGVYVEVADGTVLVAQAAELAVHPASVSKIPTTLALLRKLGLMHRFVTRVSSSGVIRDGTLNGGLLIDSEGDPFLVDENALLIAAHLNGLGVRRVAGELRVRGPLVFNWEESAAAERFRLALSGQVSSGARQAVEALLAQRLPAADRAVAGVQFVAAAPGIGGETEPRLLLAHHSQELLPLTKQLNDYSNNIFKPLAAAAGGADEVQQFARSLVPIEMRAQIRLADGAGTDARNRLSPRAAVLLLRALESELVANGRSLVDALPVSGIDAGTLQQRLDGAGESGHVVGKTGTFGDYGASALVGAVSTRDHGIVYFAILNHGVPVPTARRRQDAFVRALLVALDTRPWPYAKDARPAVERALVLDTALPASR